MSRAEIPDLRAMGNAPTLLAPENLLTPEGMKSGHAVVVADGHFTSVGPAANIASQNPRATRIDLPGCVLMPGFVDAHHHLAQAFGKALAFGEPSEIFRRIWVPLEGSLDETMIYRASKLAALEALRGGFTTVVDAGARSAEDLGRMADGVREAGLRCVLGFICNDGGESAPETRAAILDRARAHIDRYAEDPLVHASLAISIPEAATHEMLAAVAELCRQRGVVFQTHINEHLASVERSIVARGRRPFEVLQDAGALGPSTLVAHGTLMTPDEILTLRDTGTGIAYNPVASVWKGNAVAMAHLMTTMSVRLGLGTDGTRSDGFRMMDAAETCQRLAFGLQAGDFSCGAGWTWLDAASAGGADVAGLGSITGRIAPGLAADFLVIDVDVPEFQPSWDLDWEFVRLGNRDQIRAVFVNGRLRLWEGWPTDWDARALMRDVAASAKAAVAKAPILKLHPGAAASRNAAREERGHPKPAR